MIRKIAQDQGREAAYRMMAIGMVSNHLLSDHIQEEIKNAAERQNEEIEEATDEKDMHVAALASEVWQTTEKTRENGELQAGGPMREYHNMRAPAAGEASSRSPTETAPASDTCQTNVTVDTPPASSTTDNARETNFRQTAPTRQAAPDASTTTGKARVKRWSTRLPRARLDVSDTRQTNVTVDTPPARETEGELQAGGPAPAAGEASSRFPTETAPADTCQTLDTTGKVDESALNNTANKFWRRASGASAREKRRRTSGRRARRSPTGTATSQTASADINKGENEFATNEEKDEKIAEATEKQKRMNDNNTQNDEKRKEEVTPKLQVGTYVIVRKMVKAIKLNGMTGKILGYDSASGLYSVLLTSSLMRSSLGKATAIEAANLEAISEEEDGGEDLDNDPYIMDLTEQQMEDLGRGETTIDDLGNPHLRRLASKLLKAGVYLENLWIMEDVSLRIHLARKREALEITKQLDAGAITGEEIRSRIQADPEIEWVVAEFKRKLSI